jgi:hypothetical protein
MIYNIQTEAQKTRTPTSTYKFDAHLAPIASLIPAGGWDIVLRKAKVETPAKKPIPFKTELTGLNQNRSSQMT